MDLQEAQKYPLLREYDFALDISSSGGSGTLLIPKKNRFVGKKYGFGHLSVLPYLQELLEENNSFRLKSLTDELEENEEIMIWTPGLDKLTEMTPFLYRTLSKFRKDKIIEIDRLINSKNRYDFTEEDTILKGENFDTARVYIMNSMRFSNHSDFRLRESMMDNDSEDFDYLD